MTVDVGGLGLVSVTAMIAAVFVIGVAAIGVRALDAAAQQAEHGRPTAGRRAFGWACITIAGLAVVYGIYLVFA